MTALNSRGRLDVDGRRYRYEIVPLPQAPSLAVPSAARSYLRLLSAEGMIVLIAGIDEHISMAEIEAHVRSKFSHGAAMR
jgi:hypothetical protein